MNMNKKTLTDADIRTKFITPALVGPHGDKWNLMTQVREEAYFTKGRVIVRDKTVRQTYASLDAFLTVWNDAEKKQAILEELTAKGVFLDELAAQVGRDYDAFDLICHVAFDAPPLTRKERAEKVKKRNVFAKYGDKARAVLDALLQKYADSGITSVESLEILKVDPLTAHGTPVEIVKLFGGRDGYLAAIRELETALYEKAA